MSTEADFTVNPDTGQPYARKLYEGRRGRIGVHDGSMTEVVGYWVPIAHLDNFRTVVGGIAKSYSFGAGSITRIEPLQHPHHENLYATEMNWTKRGNSRSSSMYTWAECEVSFASPTFGQNESFPFMVMQYQGGGMTMSTPGIPYTYESDGKPVQLDVSRIVGVERFSISLYGLQSVNRAALKALIARVNSTPFLTPDATYGAGTVRLDNWTYGMPFKLGATTSYQVNLSFSACEEIPWNQRAREDNGVLDTLVGGPYGTLYPTADLNLALAI